MSVHEPCAYAQRCAHADNAGHNKATAGHGARDNARIVDLLQLVTIPARDELDSMGRTYAAAGLAEAAVQYACRVILLDRVKRTGLDAFLAADTRGFHLTFTDPEEIGQRE